MDLGPQTLSIFVTLFLILAAMGVALIVDLLKGNNEQLRELAIELKAKKDAAEKHLEVLEIHNTALLQQPALAAGAQGLLTESSAKGPSIVSKTTGAKPSVVPNSPAPTSPAAPAAKEPGFYAAARKGREESQPKREMSPAVAAVAQSVAARMAAGKMNPAASAPAPAAAETEPVVMAAGPAFAPPPAYASAAPVATGPALTPEIVPVEIKTGIFQAPSEARKDWSRILTNRKHEAPSPVLEAEVSAAASGDDNVIRFEQPAAARVPVVTESRVLPAGFHDYLILKKAAASGESLQGMVVSIGLNQLDAGPMAEVSKFVQSLLEAEDFGCQSGSDEFVLVCPGDGQTSQRRLSAIAEKLWDFQLRTMGQLNVQFAWGGMEARATDKLNDAVASAVDQMMETRRARRGSTVKIANAV